MIKLNDREIKLNRDQYMQLGSDYNILSDMYEMKLGHELRLSGEDYILKFLDNQYLIKLFLFLYLLLILSYI